MATFNFFGTQQELNVAMQEVGDRLKQAKESLLHSLGLHEVNRNWESDSQNPHTLESAIEASKENVLRGCNEAIRRKRQASHTVTDKELINYLMRSLQAHQQNLLNLKNAISELYEAAYEKYQSAQSEVEGAWVYVSENEANDLRWSKSEAEFLEHKNNMAREYMREINECLQRAQSEPLESDERPQT